MGRVVAEDEFRLGLLKLEYEVKEVFVCDWNRERQRPGSEIAEFCRRFVLAPSSFPLEQTFTESEMLTAILDKKVHGLVMCDLVVPQERRLE